MTEAMWGVRLSPHWISGAAACCLAVAGCTNDPYPDTDRDAKVLYSSFVEAPKTLDPAVAYGVEEHVITGNVYDTLLEYHYLERPYRLIAGLAEAVPESQTLPDGRQAYRFKIRPGVLFHADPCFTLEPERPPDPGGRRRRFCICPGARRRPRRQQSGDQQLCADRRACRLRQAPHRAAADATEFAALPVQEQYARAGGIAGVVVHGERELEIVLAEPNAQILFWFAMPFTAPVPWEAVAYYNGKEGRPPFADHPVGTGPYRLSVYEKQHRFTLERNPAWYGSLPANRDAPGAAFPGNIDARDVAEGRIDASYAGRQMPFLEHIKFYREKEDIPRFNKFLQGYYDNGGIIKESFEAVVQAGRLSPDMQARGMRLDKEVEPTIFYVGFNMRDAVLGDAAGERGRKLRQAMSLAVDAKQYLELFLNGRGLPAQTPLPPGIFGYDAELQEPLPPVRRCPRAPAARGGRLQERHRSRDQHAAQAQLRYLRDRPRGAACSSSSSPAPGARSASTSRSTPPPTINSRTRCGAAPTRSSSGAGSPISRTRRISCSCSSARTPAPRAAGRTRPTSAMPSSTGSIAR